MGMQDTQVARSPATAIMQLATLGVGTQADPCPTRLKLVLQRVQLKELGQLAQLLTLIPAQSLVQTPMALGVNPAVQVPQMPGAMQSTQLVSSRQTGLQALAEADSS